MIIDFSFNFKSFSNSTDFQDAYDSHIRFFGSSFRCPNSECSNESLLVFSTSYSRFLFLDENSSFSITISVFKCPTCGTYHAVLPAFLFPFSSYSYPFIMKTLRLFYYGPCKENKTLTCNNMHISRKVLNHFILLFSREEADDFYRSSTLKALHSLLLKLKEHPNELFIFLRRFLHDRSRPFLIQFSARSFIFVVFHSSE